MHGKAVEVHKFDSLISSVKPIVLADPPRPFAGMLCNQCVILRRIERKHIVNVEDLIGLHHIVTLCGLV